MSSTDDLDSIKQHKVDKIDVGAYVYFVLFFIISSILQSLPSRSQNVRRRIESSLIQRKRKADRLLSHQLSTVCFSFAFLFLNLFSLVFKLVNLLPKKYNIFLAVAQT